MGSSRSHLALQGENRAPSEVCFRQRRVVLLDELDDLGWLLLLLLQHQGRSRGVQVTFSIALAGGARAVLRRGE
jgi:hypothetical protein